MVRQPSFDCNGMKKGAWSEDEDNKLRAYIMRYGHWNWRLLPKYAGLSRCGKSCRLRWVNYLKPGVKRGNFSKHEQDLVVELHAKHGNKWSTIAAKLPGRSDNEIKNFWHTRIEKRHNPRFKVDANKLIRHTKEAIDAQYTFCNTTQDESISFDCLMEFEDPTLSFNTYESSETIEKPQVDFWTDIFLENDSKITCLPPLQEEDFSKFDYKVLSSFESSYQSALNWIADGDFGGESVVTYTSNSPSETSCISGDIEGLYDPCLEYFDYGMDLFT